MSAINFIKFQRMVEKDGDKIKVNKEVDGKVIRIPFNQLSDKERAEFITRCWKAGISAKDKII